MSRLKFEMRPFNPKPGVIDGYISRFTAGNGDWTESWWSSPPASIDHVGPEYLRYNYRHPNVKTDRHIEFIKRRFKEEMLKLKAVKI